MVVKSYSKHGIYVMELTLVGIKAQSLLFAPVTGGMGRHPELAGFSVSWTRRAPAGDEYAVFMDRKNAKD